MSDTDSDNAGPSRIDNLHTGAHVAPTSSRAALADLIRSPRFWAAPIVVVICVMGLLSATYVGAIVDTQKYLHDFPIDVVNEDVGASQGPNAARAQFGMQVVDGIVKGTHGKGVAITQTDRGTAFDRLGSAQTYGVIIVGQNFSQQAIDLAGSVVATKKPTPPTISVVTNRRTGTFASSITANIVDQIRDQVNAKFGAQLTDQVRASLAKANVAFVGLAKYSFTAPVVFAVSDADPLPGGAGNGLTAFYFTILLVLAGFTGALIVHSVIDGMLGFIPIEYGPKFLLQQRLTVSRRGMLVVKWWIMFVIAIVVSAVYIGVCSALGMDIPSPFTLAMFSVLVVTTVGITASSIMAVCGTPGMIINLIFFIILGLPSSGGTVPLEASPRIFSALATVEPMRQIYLGVRSILYFGGDFRAGLGQSLIVITIGLAVGLIGGAIVVRLYDAKGWGRIPAPRHHDIAAARH